MEAASVIRDKKMWGIFGGENKLWPIDMNGMYKIFTLLFIFNLINTGIIRAQNVLWEKHQLLISDCIDEKDPALDSINIFSISNTNELNKKILEIFKFSDNYPYHVCNSISIDYKDTKVNIGFTLHNSAGTNSMAKPSGIISRTNELTFRIYSNDSIKYGTSLFGNADSITSWVKEYFSRTSEMYKFYSPSFSDLVIICSADYHLQNLELIFQNTITGYITAVENFSITHFHKPLAEQDERHINAFRRSLPLNIVFDLKDIEQMNSIPPPPDSLVFQETISSGLPPEGKDTIVLPEETYLHLNRTAYTDTLVVDFFTGREFIPFYIWQNNDTIKIKKWKEMWVLNADTLDRTILKDYAPNEYYIGKLFFDGREVFYIYHTEQYLIKNDTLYSLQLKSNLPVDSTFKLALRHRIVDEGKYGYVSEYLEVINNNSYWEFDILFYKGIGCNQFLRNQPFYTHQIIMEDYWETGFGVFYNFSHYSNTNFTGGSNSIRTNYIINDTFELYQIGHQNKRLEVFKLEHKESDLEKYKLKYCR